MLSQPKEQIPVSLDAALETLDKMSSQEDKDWFSKQPEEHPGAALHFNAGMAMRNSWKLWHKEEPLTQWFRARGIWHADDMSAIIYKAFWCKVNDKPFNLDKEIAYYITFWATQGIGFDEQPLEK
jgi:hypothetical protein